jgi:hypothetical protein
MTEGIFINPFERGEIGPDLFRAACGGVSMTGACCGASHKRTEWQTAGRILIDAAEGGLHHRARGSR